MTEEYVCVDCDEAFDGRPYYTGIETPYWSGVGGEVMCASCAGPYLCPDFTEDATPEHLEVCVGDCNTPAGEDVIH